MEGSHDSRGFFQLENVALARKPSGSGWRTIGVRNMSKYPRYSKLSIRVDVEWAKSDDPDVKASLRRTVTQMAREYARRIRARCQTSGDPIDPDLEKKLRRLLMAIMTSSAQA